MEKNQRDSIPCQRLQSLLEYYIPPTYMLKRILSPEFTVMEKNMSLNLSLVKRSRRDPGAPAGPLKCLTVISKTKLMHLTQE